jgi:NB-ARC domain
MSMRDNNNLTGRNQYFPQVETRPPAQQSSSLSFNDAPIHLLSPYFTAREDELNHIGKVLSVNYGNAPARCAIYGMQDLGKQLALQYAVMSYNQQRCSLVFWISGATVEKVNQGIIKILTLVGHPDRDHPAHNTRLTSARRFLEEPNLNGPIKWLLILDNVNSEVVDFINEYLPRKNSSGNILFTTRTAAVAEALTRVEGQHQTFELRAPDAKDAANLLLVEAGIDTSSTVSSLMTRAKELVKCVGCLLLAITLAASFLKQFDKRLYNLLGLYRDQQNYEVGLIIFDFLRMVNIVGLEKINSGENDFSDYEQKSIATTFAIQFAELEHKAPDVSNLLKVLSFYDAENIPLEMIVKGAESQSYPTELVELQPDSQIAESAAAQADIMGDLSILSPNLKALISSPVQLHQAIQQLRRLSLVGARPNTDTPSLHIYELIQSMS